MHLETKTYPDGDFPDIGVEEWVPSLLDKITHFLLPAGALMLAGWLSYIFFVIIE